MNEYWALPFKKRVGHQKWAVGFLVVICALLVGIPRSGQSEPNNPIVPTPIRAQFDLNPGPYTVQNLGTFIQSATPSNSLTFTHPVTNEVHFLQLYYLATQLTVTPFQILDVNLDTGEARLVDGGYGRPDPTPMIVYPGTGHVYIPSQAPDRGTLTRYDAVTGQAKIIRRLMDKTPQGVGIGDDLKIYLGQATKGYVERYDPRLDPTEEGVEASWNDYGIIQDPGAPYYRYVYSIASDGKFMYMAIRDQHKSPIWSFVVKDLTTLEERVYWQDIDSAYTSSHAARRGYGVGCYSLPTERVCHQFNGFTMGPQVNVNSLPGSPVAIDWPTTGLPAGYAVDTNDIVADSVTSDGAIGSATLRWKKPGETVLREVTVSGIRLEPTPIRSIQSYSGTELIGFPTAYGPTFLVNPTDKSATVLGRGHISMYDAKYSHYYKKWYIIGYPSAWMEYDPTKPWTLSHTTDRYHTDTNPHFLPRPVEDQAHMMAKYFYYVQEDNKGFVYLGGHHERDSTGGSLTWYKPATTAPGKIPESWSSPWITSNYGVLREPFLQYEVTALTACLGGTKMVVGTRVCCGGIGPGKLFVIDTQSNQIERELPLTSLENAGHVVEVEPGVVLGASKDQIYKLDIVSGQMQFTRTTQAEVSSRLARGPDGWVWGFWGNRLYRVSGLNGTMEKIVDTEAGAFTFHRGDMYIANKANIYQVKGLFQSDATASVFAAEGKVTFLRVHDVGTGWGPPADFLDVEVVIKLDSQSDKAFGFRLRNDNQRLARQGMLDLLRDAFNNNWTVTIDFGITPGKNNGTIIRTWLTK